MNIEQLNDQFGLEGELGFSEWDEGMVVANISNKHAEADISLYGGQIISFTPYRTMDLLWVSPYSAFEKGKAIRGGIPVCFPWFGPHPAQAQLPQHGFARLTDWKVIEAQTLEGGETLLALSLHASEETRKYWPHAFEATITFVVGKKLQVGLKVENTSSESFSYTEALHSYFNISALENIQIYGLANTRYHNQLDGGDYLQQEDILEINEPITRHYYDTEAPTILEDPVFNRKIRISKKGSKNTTVWNPGAETCAQMSDMPNDAWQTFVCIETVNKINSEILLAPGESHEMRAIIELVE